VRRSEEIVRTASVFVDGVSSGGVSDVVLRDRKTISRRTALLLLQLAWIAVPERFLLGGHSIPRISAA